MKRKIAFATRADEKNMKYYEMFSRSLQKFHPDVDIHLWDEAKIATYKDEVWFYRASPMMGLELIEEYDMVILADCDQLVLGSLNHIFDMDADIGTVLNINRVDPPQYGLVQFQGIAPNEYYNNGLVAVRSTEKGKEFLREWNRLCHTKYFHRLQFREQDMLNLLAHYGDYKVECFDHYDRVHNNFTWNGLVSRGEWHRAIKSGADIIIPKGEDNYPDHDITLKIVHWAGGSAGKKMNYRAYFSEEVCDYIETLLTP